MIPPHLRIGLDVYKMVLIEMVGHFTSLYLKLSLYIKFTYRYLLEVVLAAVEPRLAYRKCWKYFFELLSELELILCGLEKVAVALYYEKKNHPNTGTHIYNMSQQILFFT